MNYKTPGVYIEEIPKLPPSIAQVETAIPAFIGYTEKAKDERTGEELLLEPKRIRSLLEYERLFGMPAVEEGLSVVINGLATPPIIQAAIDPTKESKYKMYYALQIFFANGGGPCWIVSVGDYQTKLVDDGALTDGLNATEKIDEITLYVYPDAQGLDNAGIFYGLFNLTVAMCEKLKDRFTVMDIWMDSALEPNSIDNVGPMRSITGSEENKLKYGAIYFPNIETTLNYYYGGEGDGDANVIIDGTGVSAGDLASLKSENNTLYFQAQNALRNLPMQMPPSPAVVGKYADVDNSRGVWKAPANVNIDLVLRPLLKVTDEEQEGLNVDSNSGKSVNVIRSFVGRGPSIIWGARTLAGNSNEWRYVSVRRFFNMVEESVKKATIQFVFEPNDLNTWTRVKSMIDNFLVQQWRAGALMGTTPEQAFFVKVGLNETMDEVDIWEGRMIVEIGMAVVRPAEFIILRFSHKMLSE
ncbi:phage tail sheath family protein [Aquimarina sp. MMG016]|uniref:phage tail sheath family protein n=1 Tax=Aquimarina sp. MMG016 TaxID=2822690 RepID=UPI001B3A71BF|nr:phage tail sheath family protein [Aquimarina sp. MMG016]MBQ4818588.1 phage tail sheath family protein [Aquimarina sp. MMG016]